MKRGKLPLQIILVFVICIIGYALVFRWIENRRVAKGPWTVTFMEDSKRPVLEVNQAALSLHQIRITFLEVTAPTNGPQTVAFSEARQVPYPVPFGECVFQDTLFQPGTVALKLFGHQIQLMPRTLTIDGVEHPWRSGEVIELRDKSAK